MSHEFTVTSSELLVDAPIIALRRDRVVMPGGGGTDREVVEHFGAVAVVALDADGRVALVEQYRRSVDRRLIELPAGLLDVGDEPALECARRELQEEAGLAANNWEVLVDIVTSPGFSDEAVRIFLATDLREVDRPEAEHEEADMALHVVPLETAQKQVLAGKITNSIAVAGILAAAAVVAGAAQTRGTEVPFDLRPTRLAERRKALGLGADMKRI
ncbi:NUDIX domain-containing protein [Corynebacterium sp. LK2510]|uniref:NUDIX domain-containing protein n=1 Tax=Corynebacterium sp. LK2510 TaxID=3110472 RepID=UPI0034CF227A